MEILKFSSHFCTIVIPCSYTSSLIKFYIIVLLTLFDVLDISWKIHLGPIWNISQIYSKVHAHVHWKQLTYGNMWKAGYFISTFQRTTII